MSTALVRTLVLGISLAFWGCGSESSDTPATPDMAASLDMDTDVDASIDMALEQDAEIDAAIEVDAEVPADMMVQPDGA